MYKISISPEELEALELRSFPGKIIVVDEEGPVFKEAIRYLKRQKVIGFDTETRPSFDSRRAQFGTALLQLSGPTHAYLFRLKKLGMPQPLCQLLADPSVIKVGAAVGDDIHGLQHLHGFRAQSFVDLQKIAWEYGIRDMSVKKLTAIILGFKISKAQQLSNWEADRLSAPQQLYAATDAWVCREMYVKLCKSEKHPLTPEERIPPQALENQRRQAEERAAAGEGAKRSRSQGKTKSPAAEAKTQTRSQRRRRQRARSKQRKAEAAALAALPPEAIPQQEAPRTGKPSSSQRRRARRKRSRARKSAEAANSQNTQNNG